MIAANGIVVAVATPRTDKATQRRHRPRPSSSGRPFVVTLVFVGLLVAAFYGYRSYRDRHVTITFDNGQDPVPALDLTFFPDQLAFRAPSPPPALGMQRLENGASVVVGEDLVPGHGIVRYQGEGVGSGVAYVQLGKPPPTIQLRLPQTLSGRVGEPMVFRFMGWPSAGFRPVVDAEVVVMGGGEHGIDLATTRTDAEGRFSVTGFDGELNALGLRVRAAGFAIVHEPIQDLAQHPDEQAIIAVTPVAPRRGHLQLKVDVDPTSLRLLARGLPGVETVPGQDGMFTLDHIPTDAEARIVVYGLPENCAQNPARTLSGEVVRVVVEPGAIVSGRILNSEGKPVAGALVWVGDEPATSTDPAGNYRLVRVLPGNVTVTAQWQRGKGRKARQLLGSRLVELEPNGRHTDIDITLDS